MIMSLLFCKCVMFVWAYIVYNLVMLLFFFFILLPFMVNRRFQMCLAVFVETPEAVQMLCPQAECAL